MQATSTLSIKHINGAGTSMLLTTNNNKVIGESITMVDRSMFGVIEELVTRGNNSVSDLCLELEASTSMQS
jgi:hypothetical protein